MKVNDLIDRLESIKRFGYGNMDIEAFDADSEQWEIVTCLTYGGDEPVRIYTDES